MSVEDIIKLSDGLIAVGVMWYFMRQQQEAIQHVIDNQAELIDKLTNGHDEK